MPGIPLRPACSSDSVFDRSRKRWRWCFAERTCWRRDSLHRHIVTSASKLTIDLQSSRFTIHDSRFTIHDLTIHDLTIQRVSYPREEIIEQLIINLSTLGMVLHSKSEGIVAQSCLFDDVIGGAPRLHFETGAQFVNRLMMRAIHFFKGMARFAVGSERLDIVRLLIGQVMACDVETFREKWREIFLVRAAHPGADITHAANCRHSERSRGIPWRRLEGNATGSLDFARDDSLQGAAPSQSPKPG